MSKPDRSARGPAYDWMRGFGLLLAALLVVAGCASTNRKLVSFAAGERNYDTLDYEPVVVKWTRHNRLQTSFDKVEPFVIALDVRATFNSWDWRWAYTERYAQHFGLSDAERVKLRQEQLAEAEKFHEFHVMAAASRDEWANLLKTGPNSVWRITLFDDSNREVEPNDRFKVKLPIATEIAFYPYVGSIEIPFSTRVFLRFPTKFPDGTPTISANTKRVTLRFTGPLGTVDLAWRAGDIGDGS